MQVAPTQYGNPYGNGYYSAPAPYMPGATPYGPSPYAGDVYRPTGPYQTGYVQGAGAAYGTSSAVSSAASGFGNIFSTITGLIASILNAIVKIFVNIGKAILGLFGIGKKEEKPQQPGQGNMPAPPVYPGAVQPGQIPPPPPGTDIEQATNVVRGDLQPIADPGQAIRVIDLHAKNADSSRRFAKEAAEHAEQLAKEAAILAERIAQSQGRMPPQELNQIVSELEFKKTKAIEELKKAEEYTKATYDEALYAQLAANTLIPRFPQIPALGRDASEITQNAWKNWTTGVDETKYLFFKNHHPPAPEVFTRAVGTVNGYLGQVDQTLGRVMVRR